MTIDQAKLEEREQVLIIMKACLDHAAAIMTNLADREPDPNGIILVEVSGDLMKSILDPRGVVVEDYDKFATFVSATVNSEGPTSCTVWEIAHGLQHAMPEQLHAGTTH